MRLKYLFFLFLAYGSSLIGKPFIVGDLMGQLGNQFFIIATTTSLALDHDAEAIFPSLSTDKRWNIPCNQEHVFAHLNSQDPKDRVDYVYIEPHFHYSPIEYHPNMSIRGWFQSEKYFRHHREEIINLFSPSEAISTYLKEHYGFIIDHPKTVAIHYRNYDQEDPNHQVYVDCDLAYYEKAIATFDRDHFFIVFSNDIERCKNRFKDIDRLFYYVEGEPHYHDLYLMSLCQHQIICNSSFSWWGAYLNKNPTKKVIAPLAWFDERYQTDDKDLIPEEWMRL